MSEDQSIKRLYREVIPSVVSVYVTREDHRTGQQDRGSGSGFVYGDGYVVTNDHVVGTTDEVELRFHDGQWRMGRVVGADPYTDLAVIVVDDLPSEAAALPVAESNPEPGERVVAIGNPMGLHGTITVGYVSGTERATPTESGFSLPEIIQTDAAINPGNSGGPLLTLDGVVVGVSRAKAGENIGFAIGPAIVNRVVPALIEDGAFRPAYLSVRMLDVSPTVAEANGLDEPTGALVVEVGGEYAGDPLRGCDRVVEHRNREIPVGGDVLVGIDDRPVRSTGELTSYLLTEVSPGDSVALTIRRDGVERAVTVMPGERPAPRGPDRHRDRRRHRRPSPR